MENSDACCDDHNSGKLCHATLLTWYRGVSDSFVDCSSILENEEGITDVMSITSTIPPETTETEAFDKMRENLKALGIAVA